MSMHLSISGSVPVKRGAKGRAPEVVDLCSKPSGNERNDPRSVRGKAATSPPFPDYPYSVSIHLKASPSSILPGGSAA